MIKYTTATNDRDLYGIIALQKANLAVNLAPGDIQSQGFVTVVHRFEDLQKMNAIEESIVARDGNRVIAYLLAMTQLSKQDIPVLVPMFALFERVEWKGRPVAAYQYLVVGQVCVDKAYRGQGVLDKCYAAYKNQFSSKYDFAITEIATKNGRSINAHKRIGFEEVYRYTAPGGEEWSIVIWDWAQGV